VTIFEYLGTHFISYQYLKVDINQSVRQFYGSVHAIYNHTRFVCKFPRLSLFESYSLPYFTYNCVGLFLSNDQLRKLNVCWTNVYRKVFAMNKWESVKCIQFSMVKM